MSKRIEQSRRHGHFDPRYGGRISVVTPRNTPAEHGADASSAPAPNSIRRSAIHGR